MSKTFDRAAAAVMTCALLGLCTPVLAEDVSEVTASGNLGLYSRYVFRGMSQTAHEPALQGGVEFSHPSGVYAGLWGSNVDWLQNYQGYRTGSLELDTYGGWRGNTGNGFSYDLGVIRYNYPGERPTGVVAADTNEIYAGGGWGWLTATLYYSLGDTFGFATPAGSTYFDISASIPLADTGLSAALHWGRQRFRGDARAFGYEDWKLALSYDLGRSGALWKGMSVGVQYTRTNADHALWTDRNGIEMGRSRATVWIARSF